MFDKLKQAFSNAAKSISQKELSEQDLDESLFDLNVSLLESDVSQDVIDDLSKQIKNNLVGMKLQKNETTEQIIASTLKENFSKILSKAGSVDLVSAINSKKQSKGGPFIIVFLGINGTGKTTTVAKVANLLKKSGFSIVIAAADTHRAGAIEQITSHAEKLSIKIISQRYGADPSAVSRDAVEYAKKHYVDVVLIDTAGRMQTAKNLMDEIGKIVKVIKPDIKLFIGDSLAGNDTINQAREFFSYTEFDGAILTKTDADAKGGSAISISYITSKPIIYLGIGQSYDDIIMFDKDKFVETVFNNGSLIDSHKLSQTDFSSDKEKYPTFDQDIVIDQAHSGIKNDEILKVNNNTLNEESTSEDDLISKIKDTENTGEKIYNLNEDMMTTELESEITKTHSDSNIFDTSNDKSSTSNERRNSVTEEEKGQDKKKGRFGWFKKKK